MNAYAATGEILTDDAWIALLAIAFGVIALLAAGMSAVVMFMLRGLRESQTKIAGTQQDIWAWAREETRAIEHKIDRREELIDKELRDIRTWVRHKERNLYTQMIRLAQLIGAGGQEIEQDILEGMAKLDD